MNRPSAIAAALCAVFLLPGLLFAQGEKQVKVLLEFRQTGTQSGDDLHGSGTVILEKGGPYGTGSLGARSTTITSRRSTGIFTIVQDGGASTLSVNTRVPYREVAFFHDYVTGKGYVASGVAFENVGTALKVRAWVLPDGQVRVNLTPTISYFSPDHSGSIELTEASSEVIVRSGAGLVLGGSTSETHDVTRRILGLGQESGSSETTLVLTATIQ